MIKSSVILALALSSALQSSPQLRVAEVEVESVHPMHSMVTFVDDDGEAWIAEVDEVSGYSVGKDCVLVYDTMDTDDIYDDEIVAIAEMEVLHG